MFRCCVQQRDARGCHPATEAKARLYRLRSAWKLRVGLQGRMINFATVATVRRRGRGAPPLTMVLADCALRPAPASSPARSWCGCVENEQIDCPGGGLSRPFLRRSPCSAFSSAGAAGRAWRPRKKKPRGGIARRGKCLFFPAGHAPAAGVKLSRLQQRAPSEG